MAAKIQYDESSVLKQLAEGNESAFNEIYSRYSPIVYKVAYRFLRSTELVQDLVQEIFAILWDKRANLAGVEHFRAYLIVMSKNLAYQYLLKLSKETLAKKDFAQTLKIAENSTERDLIGRELETLLEKTVDLLPHQQKQVFHLAKVQGMSYDAIAEFLNISPNTVKNHIIAANHFIRKHLRHASSITSIIIGFLCRVF